MKVDWHHWVWNSYNVPKHSFIAWMLMLGKLKTRERLKAAGVVSDDRCVLCFAETETSNHVFFNCYRSKRVCEHIMLWMGIRMGNRETIYTSWKKWGRQCRSRNRQKAYYAVQTAMVYHLWMYRNYAYWNNVVRNPEIIVKEIKQDIKHRMQSCVTLKWNREDRNWLSNIV
ncbi:uncharacterized protein LOC130590211 [Beta vulgaris subsp. vulgaris]|uniref:uncharacterized protein LOC130590211 n=1 Tax=Beta vulgaris subsp. vulgaris TaxID=3555 RepID=UPI00203752EB|nr:uncharacterized protein LOC130590211 [Beta vulgaris subsp. vulgaris]